MGCLCAARWSIGWLSLQPGHDKWCMVLPWRLDYLNFLHETDIYLNISLADLQDCYSTGLTITTSLQCGLFTSRLRFLWRKSALTYAMSVQSRIYRFISAQMLVGRAVARDEHNSAYHTIKCELINISWESSWKVKRRIQSSVGQSVVEWASCHHLGCGGPDTRLQPLHVSPTQAAGPCSQSKLITHSGLHPHHETPDWPY